MQLQIPDIDTAQPRIKCKQNDCRVPFRRFRMRSYHIHHGGDIVLCEWSNHAVWRRLRPENTEVNTYLGQLMIIQILCNIP